MALAITSINRIILLLHFLYLGGLGRISWKEGEAPFVRVVSFSEVRSKR